MYITKHFSYKCLKLRIIFNTAVLKGLTLYFYQNWAFFFIQIHIFEIFVEMILAKNLLKLAKINSTLIQVKSGKSFTSL